MNCQAEVWPIQNKRREDLQSLELVIVTPSQRHIKNRLTAPSVTFAVTTHAKRYQVVHDVATELALGFHVMNVQAFHGTALLAPPAISFEHACPEDCVSFGIQFESRSFLSWTRRIH